MHFRVYERFTEPFTNAETRLRTVYQRRNAQETRIAYHPELCASLLLQQEVLTART